MRLLTLEQLLQIHAFVVGETGGSMGLRDIGRLESAIATQTQNVFGEELYTSAYEKAAAIMRGIIADRPFIDGNKRTAMLAGLALLRVNSIYIVAPAGEIEDFAVQIAIKRLDVPAIALWLQRRTKR